MKMANESIDYCRKSAFLILLILMSIKEIRPTVSIMPSFTFLCLFETRMN
uniref:Uncharacterized protein n=1 Tax=Amphimedon queenslandica TaxID=400682 RepID=A0A1X7VR82_AMPQE